MRVSHAPRSQNGALTNTLVRVFTSHLGDRFGYRAVLYPSLLLVPVAFVILAFTSTRWEMIASAIVFGKVISGIEVVDQIREGDKMKKVWVE